MPSLKSSVLCFCASSCVEMFEVISHTGASSDIDENQQSLLGMKGIRVTISVVCFLVQPNGQ